MNAYLCNILKQSFYLKKLILIENKRGVREDPSFFCMYIPCVYSLKYLSNPMVSFGKRTWLLDVLHLLFEIVWIKHRLLYIGKVVFNVSAYWTFWKTLKKTSEIFAHVIKSPYLCIAIEKDTSLENIYIAGWSSW